MMEFVKENVKRTIVLLMVITMIIGLLQAEVFAVTKPDGIRQQNLSNGSFTVNSDEPLYIYQTGSGTTSNTITINSNATIYLDGVNILVPRPTSAGDISKPNPININGPYTVNLYLVNGSINTLASQAGSTLERNFRLGSSKAGLRVPSGATLNIYGDTGVLNATGAEGYNVNNSIRPYQGGGGAGIGSNGGWSNLDNTIVYPANSGIVNIHGGIINARGGNAAGEWGSGGSGIGAGGYIFDMQPTTLQSGKVTIENAFVTAIGGDGAQPNLAENDNRESGWAIGGDLTIKVGGIIIAKSGGGHYRMVPLARQPILPADYRWRKSETAEFTSSSTATFTRASGDRYVEINAEELLSVSDIETPAAITSGSKLNLIDPTVTGTVTSQGWQYSPDQSTWTNFVPTIRTFSASEDGYYIRYYATNDNGTKTSNTVQITVNKYSPTLTISAEPTAATYPEDVVLTATLSGSDRLDGKSVRFFMGDFNLGVRITDSNGKATYTQTSPLPMDHSFRAVFEGDDNNNETSDTIQVKVVRGTQSTVSFADTSDISKTYGEGSFALPTVSGGNGTGQYIYYSSNNNVVTVSEGTVTIVGAGEATVKVYKFGDIYYYQSVEDSIKVIVSPKPVTISGVVANDKEYNGTMSTTYDFSSATIDGLINSDTVSINNSNATASFSDKNVGENKTVTFNGFALSGANAANYILSKQPESVTANITPKEITVSGISALDKIYDGNDSATLSFSNVIYNHKLESDSLTLTAIGTFTNENVGVNRVVNITSIELEGESATNYVLSTEGQQTSTTASISSATITVTPISGQFKYYGQLNSPLSFYSSDAIEGQSPAFSGSLSRAIGEIIADDYQINRGTLALSDNQSFIASNYQLVLNEIPVTFEIKEYTTTAAANATPNGENGWFNSAPITLFAPAGYLISTSNAVSGNPWVFQITINDADGVNKEITYYLRKSTALNHHAISTSKTFYYDVDKTAPDGDISIEENSVKTLLNNITFGLFFNKNIDVSITASDETSGVAKIEYHKSTTTLDAKALHDVSTWVEYTGVFSETAVDASKFIYYAKITDNAGNVTYIASNGVTFDTTPPEIHNITDEAVYYVDQNVSVSDTNLDSITLNGNVFESGAKLVGDIEETYVLIATDKAGNSTTYTVEMKTISSLSLSIDSLTVENVTSDDKTEIEAILSNVQAVLLTTENGALQEQVDKLNSIITKCNELLDKIQNIEEMILDVNTKTTKITTDNVKSSDKEDLEDALETILELLDTDNLTKQERIELEEKKTDIENNLKTIEDIQDLILNIYQSIQDITEDNVVNNDKTILEKALNDIQIILEDRKNNLTDEEIKDIEDKIALIRNIINTLDEVALVEGLIKALPNSSEVTKKDVDAIVKAKEAYEKLSEYQKEIVDSALKTKLDLAIGALRQLLLFDAPTGTRVEGVNGTVFDLKTELVVTTIMDVLDEVTKEGFRLGVSSINDDLQLIQLYDIKLMLDGVVVQPEGMVKVTLILTDEQLNYTDLQVVFIDQDGIVTLVSSKIDGNEMTFITDHFSYYGIVGTPVNIQIPDTKDSSSTFPFIALILATMILVGTRKRKIETEKK